MVKALLCITALLIASLACNAQSSHSEIAVEAGAGMVNLFQPEMEVQEYSASVGYAMALNYQYHFTNVIAVRAGVGYALKGAMLPSFSLNEEGTEVTEENTYQKFNYLYVPILGRIHLGNECNFYLNLGPYMGYLTHAAYSVQTFETSMAGESQKNYRNVDIGFTGGVGGIIPINNSIKFTVELRSDFGLYDIQNTPFDDADELYTRSANVMVGMQYKLP